MPRVARSASPTASPRGAQPKYDWEPFAASQPDIAKLLEAHWREVDIFHDDAPLNPDWERYAQLDQFGWLGIVTVRIDGVMIGYMTLIIGPHLHHKAIKWATVDVMYVHPNFRKGWTGVRLIKFAERGLRKLGTKVFWFSVKAHFTNANGRTVEEVLKFLGFNYVEATYAKVLK